MDNFLALAKLLVKIHGPALRRPVFPKWCHHHRQSGNSYCEKFNDYICHFWVFL